MATKSGFSNVGAEWSSGDLTFVNKATGATICTINDDHTQKDYTATNVSADRAIDATAANAAEVRMVLATLVADLIDLGILA